MGFTHETLGQLRANADYIKAVKKVRAEQFRLHNELEERIGVVLNAQDRVKRLNHFKHLKRSNGKRKNTRNNSK